MAVVVANFPLVTQEALNREPDLLDVVRYDFADPMCCKLDYARTEFDGMEPVHFSGDHASVHLHYISLPARQTQGFMGEFEDWMKRAKLHMSTLGPPLTVTDKSYVRAFRSTARCGLYRVTSGGRNTKRKRLIQYPAPIGVILNVDGVVFSWGKIITPDFPPSKTIKSKSSDARAAALSALRICSRARLVPKVGAFRSPLIRSMYGAGTTSSRMFKEKMTITLFFEVFRFVWDPITQCAGVKMRYAPVKGKFQTPSGKVVELSSGFLESMAHVLSDRAFHINRLRDAVRSVDGTRPFL